MDDSDVTEWIPSTPFITALGNRIIISVHYFLGLIAFEVLKLYTQQLCQLYKQKLLAMYLSLKRKTNSHVPFYGSHNCNVFIKERNYFEKQYQYIYAVTYLYIAAGDLGKVINKYYLLNCAVRTRFLTAYIPVYEVRHA